MTDTTGADYPNLADAHATLVDRNARLRVAVQEVIRHLAPVADRTEGPVRDMAKATVDALMVALVDSGPVVNERQMATAARMTARSIEAGIVPIVNVDDGWAPEPGSAWTDQFGRTWHARDEDGDLLLTTRLPDINGVEDDLTGSPDWVWGEYGPLTRRGGEPA